MSVLKSANVVVVVSFVVSSIVSESVMILVLVLVPLSVLPAVPAVLIILDLGVKEPASSTSIKGQACGFL